jgi:hypothetical protein
MLVLGDPDQVTQQHRQRDTIQKKSSYSAQGVQGRKVFPVTQRRGTHSNTVVTKSSLTSSTSNCSETTSDSSETSTSTSDSEDQHFHSSNRIVRFQEYEPTVHDLAADVSTLAAAAQYVDREVDNLNPASGKIDTMNQHGLIHPSTSTAASAMCGPLNTSSSNSKAVTTGSATATTAAADANTESLDDGDLPIFEEVMCESEVIADNKIIESEEKTGAPNDTSTKKIKSLQKLISKSVKKAVRKATPSSAIAKPISRTKKREAVKTSPKAKRARLVSYPDSDESDELLESDSSNSENGSEAKTSEEEPSESDSECPVVGGRSRRGTAKDAATKKKTSAPTKKTSSGNNRSKTANPKTTTKNKRVKKSKVPDDHVALSQGKRALLQMEKIRKLQAQLDVELKIASKIFHVPTK